MDHIEQIQSIRQQLAAALAALPHDYDEACQRLLAANNTLAALVADAEREVVDLAAWLDAEEALAGRAEL